MSRDEVAVIGAGPAGVSAAVQLRRSGIDVKLYEADTVGGLVRNANLVENLVGFPEGIAGPELAARLAAHLVAADVEPRYERVLSVAHDDAFSIRTDRCEIQVRRLIIATGTEPLPLPAVSLPEPAMERVLYEVHTLAGLRGARVAIVGGGDAAFDYGLQLARRNDVLILNRSAQQRCLPLLWARASTCPALRYEGRATVRSIVARGDGVRIAYDGAHGRRELDADRVLVAVGRRPRLGFLDAALRDRVDELVGSGMLYLAGDVRNGSLRQVAIAAGDGLRAAMVVRRALDEEGLCAS